MSDNKIMEITIQHIHDQIKTLNNTVEKLSDKQIEMNEVLIRNTITVEEHQRRSTAIEGWAKETTDVLKGLTISLTKVDSDVKRVDDEILPIKNHVEKVNKIVNFVSGVPTVLKVVIMFGTIGSAIYGVVIFVHSLIDKVK